MIVAVGVDGTLKTTDLALSVLQFLTGVNEFTDTQPFSGYAENNLPSNCQGCGGSGYQSNYRWSGSATASCPVVNGQQTKALSCGYELPAISSSCGSYGGGTAWDVDTSSSFRVGSVAVRIVNDGYSCRMSSFTVAKCCVRSCTGSNFTGTVMVRCML